MNATKDLHRFTPDNQPIVIAWFDDFDGPNNFRALSNFYIGEPLSIPGLGSAQTYMTGEHAYAAMKCWGIEFNGYDRIVAAPDPQSAKTLGRTLPIRSDWEEVKYDVMMAVLRAKFTLAREEGAVLLNTGDALLIEGTYWEDEVWGVDLRIDSDPLLAFGRNWLGTMLMARRAELKIEKMFNHIRTETGRCNAEFATEK